jgi:hypothetical protein
MDFYSKGFGAIRAPTLEEAMESIRGTSIDTYAATKAHCGTCKYYTPKGDLGDCTFHSRKEKRPIKVHEMWYCKAYKPSIRATNLGGGSFSKALLADGRDVTPGDAPWSTRGEYGTNVKLMRNGQVFAIMNFGNHVRTSLQEGSHLPISDIFTFKSLGEKDGVWTIEGTTDVAPGYFDNMLKLSQYRFSFALTPQVYTSIPLNISWVATDEALYGGVMGSSTLRTQRNVKRDGHDYVPAGRVTDLSGPLIVDVERPRFAEPGSEDHRITRRITLKVRCRNG